MPDTAFKAIAGTNVTTDMLFFQKHLNKGYVADDLAFSGSIRYDKDNRIWLNPYFDGEYNSQVLGTYEVRNFNGGTLSVKGTSDNLIASVQTALNHVKAPREIDRNEVIINPDVLTKQVIDTSIPAEMRENLGQYSFGIRVLRFTIEITKAFESEPRRKKSVTMSMKKATSKHGTPNIPKNRLIDLIA